MSGDLLRLKKGDSVKIDWSDLAAERGDRLGNGGICYGEVVAVVKPGTIIYDSVPKGYKPPWTITKSMTCNHETYLVAVNGSMRAQWPARRRLTRI